MPRAPNSDQMEDPGMRENPSQNQRVATTQMHWESNPRENASAKSAGVLCDLVEYIATK